MLKNVPAILTPELLKILMEMGHGDELIIGDGNFPAASHARRLVRLDGHGVPEVLEAIMKFFPLDTFVDSAAGVMEVVKGHDYKPEIWQRYREIFKGSGEKFNDFEFVERFEFYERAKKAYAIISTGETSLYANLILKKGVVI